MQLTPNALASPESALWKEIFELCKSQATGTLFLASDNNKPGQFVVENGFITAVAYGGAYGEEALTLLSQLPNIRFSYSGGMVYPVMEKINPDHTSILLVAMGFIKSEIEASEASQKANESVIVDDKPDHEVQAAAKKKKQKTVTYRGRTVLVDVEEDDEESASKKPVKYYRGRPIVD